MVARLQGKENSWGMVISFRGRSRKEGRGEGKAMEGRGREERNGREGGKEEGTCPTPQSHSGIPKLGVAYFYSP